MSEALERLLLDLHFCRSQLLGKGVTRLLEDYDLMHVALDAAKLGGAEHSTASQLAVIRDAIALSSHVLANEPEQLRAQLLARLWGHDQPSVQSLLRQAREVDLPTTPWLMPLRRSLVGPFGSLQRIFSAGAPVNVIAKAGSGDLLCGCQDGNLRLWSKLQGREIQRFENENHPVTALLMVDHRRFVSGDDTGSLSVWSLDAPQSWRTVDAHPGLGGIVAISKLPDGRLLSAGGQDYSVKVWAPDCRTQLAALTGHDFVLRSLAVLPDGRHIVSSAGDDTMRVWDLQSEKQVACFSAPEQGFTGGLAAL